MLKKLPKESRSYLRTNIVCLILGLIISELGLLITLKFSLVDSIKWILAIALFAGLVFRFLYHSVRVIIYTQFKSIENNAVFLSVWNAKLIIARDSIKGTYEIVYVNKFDKEYSLDGLLFTGRKYKLTDAGDIIKLLEKPFTVTIE